MIYRVLSLVLILVLCLVSSCKKQEDPYFSISSDQVGLLTRDALYENVKELYARDSLVEDTLQLTIGTGNKKLKIFESGGKHLLTLTPSTDSLPRIGHILVADSRYATAEGIGLLSTFGDIKKQYTVRKIITSLNNVVILLEGSDVYFTIDKKELPAHLRYTKTQPIEQVEIPDAAKIKYLMIGWD